MLADELAEFPAIRSVAGEDEVDRVPRPAGRPVQEHVEPGRVAVLEARTRERIEREAGFLRELRHPQIVELVHEDYIAAGAEVITAKATALTEAAMKMGQQIYEKDAAAQASPGADTAAAGDEDVVADVDEVLPVSQLLLADEAFVAVLRKESLDKLPQTLAEQLAELKRAGLFSNNSLA